MRDPGACRPVEPRRLRPVADDENDFGRIGRVGSGVDQRLQVRPAARDQNADFEPCHRRLRMAAPARCRPKAGMDPLRCRWRPRENCAITASGRSGRREHTGSGSAFAMTLPPMPARPAAEADGGLPVRLCCSCWRSASPALTAPGAGSRPVLRDGRRSTPPPTPRPRPARWRASTGSAARSPRSSSACAGGGAPAKPPKLDDKAITDLVAQLRGRERADVGGALRSPITPSISARLRSGACCAGRDRPRVADEPGKPAGSWRQPAGQAASRPDNRQAVGPDPGLPGRAAAALVG